MSKKTLTRSNRMMYDNDSQLGYIVPRGTFSNVQRHFQLSQLVVGEVRDAANLLQCTKQPQPQRIIRPQNVNRYHNGKTLMYDKNYKGTMILLVSIALSQSNRSRLKSKVFVFYHTVSSQDVSRSRPMQLVKSDKRLIYLYILLTQHMAFDHMVMRQLLQFKSLHPHSKQKPK